MTDIELANLIDMRFSEDQDTAIKRYVRETKEAWIIAHTPMKCGHPRQCLVGSYDDGPSICGWCEEIAWLKYRLAKLYNKNNCSVDDI